MEPLAAANSPREIRGRELRYELFGLITRSPRGISVPALIIGLRQIGFVAPDPANKSIADALRWEVRRGRVVRLERGRYAKGHMTAAAGRARWARFKVRRELDLDREAEIAWWDHDPYPWGDNTLPEWLVGQGRLASRRGLDPPA